MPSYANKIIVINRNPLDTLISCINMFRIFFVNDGHKLLPIHIASLKALFGTEFNPSSFLNNFTLQNLQKQDGLLDRALIAFADNGTAIKSFSAMAGPWALFADSYRYAKIPVLHIRYEDIVSQIRLNMTGTANYDETERLSSFLGVDHEAIIRGFKLQFQYAAIKQKNKSAFFSNQNLHNYNQYFSREAISYFAKMYETILRSYGYEGFL